MNSRTHEAIERQIEAMGAEVFEVERDFSAVLTREGARRWVKRVKAAAREQAGYF